MISHALGAGDRRFKSSHPDYTNSRENVAYEASNYEPRTTRSTTPRRKGPARGSRAITLAALILALLTALAGRDAGTSSGASQTPRGLIRRGDARAHHRPGRRAASPWASAGISHYADGSDGYLGHRAACGPVTTRTSNFAAALSPRLAHCGMRLTVCYRTRCVHTTIEDTGRARVPGRALDAANGLYQRLGFHGLAVVRYRKGWS